MLTLSETLVAEIGEVQRTFSAVKENETYDRETFGDAELVLGGPQIWVRFLRERGKVFMELRGNAGDWIDANEVLERLNVYASVKPPVPITELVTLVCSNADKIKEII